MYDFLKKLPLFADLPEDDLDRLCEMVEEVYLPTGKELFAEGDTGDRAYVIKEGLIEIIKFSAGREVLLAIRQAGEVIGEMSLLEAAPRIASARARTNSVLLAISQEQLDHLVNTSPSAAKALLHTVTAKLRSTDIMLRQSEKMAQLGTITAGMAHELNNPAAAAQRGAQQLRQTIANLQQAQINLNKLGLTGSQYDALLSLEQMVRERSVQVNELDSLDRSDREYELETWLEEQGVENGWEYAPNLVNLGINPSDLSNIAADFSNEQFPAVLTWLCENYNAYGLMEEIDQGAGRIAEIVKAMKQYVYLDQAPVQAVDIHEGLDNTYVLLRGKLKSGIKIRREYAENLPKIQAYGSELNQVWTNILDNAIDALNEYGEIIIRTRQEDQWVIVEIEDNGPGIPESIQSKVFDPFFTTKPPGKGTGLGLNISYNIVQKHGGEIKLFSRPGKTLFEVRLPLNFEAVQIGSQALPGITRPDDETLLDILKTANTIAVVGITDHPDRPSFSVPAYLQKNGYRIIPVNPNLESVLGETSYPDLKAVPEPVDVVLIFRRSEMVPPIVDEAIQIGAKVVWMQEGVVNEQAAETAFHAGLKVVMDTCMRVQHKRLMAVETH